MSCTSLVCLVCKIASTTTPSLPPPHPLQETWVGLQSNIQPTKHGTGVKRINNQTPLTTELHYSTTQYWNAVLTFKCLVWVSTSINGHNDNISACCCFFSAHDWYYNVERLTRKGEDYPDFGVNNPNTSACLTHYFQERCLCCYVMFRVSNNASHSVIKI